MTAAPRRRRALLVVRPGAWSLFVDSGRHFVIGAALGVIARHVEGIGRRPRLKDRTGRTGRVEIILLAGEIPRLRRIGNRFRIGVRVLRRLGEIDPPSDTFSLVLTVPLLVTNLTATALMTYKTWCVSFTLLSLIAPA